MSQPKINEYVNAAYVQSGSDESAAQIDSALDITSENMNITATDDNEAATKSSLSSFDEVILSDKNKENTSAEEEDDEVPGLPQYPLPAKKLSNADSHVTHDKSNTHVTILESNNLGKIIESSYKNWN